ncbi:TlpA disulfide reductase family protein [Patulibacter sp. NPDC049589]|uniref:TlpA family protein disulfide reductase n=1 Tax=Patulibacter sp. NPDC049589 TaxID=3154731 RepID=UPI003444D85D
MARLRPHRRALAAGVVLALIVVALVVGLSEGGTGTEAPDDVPTLAAARADVAGAPTALARLYSGSGGRAAAGGVPVLDLGRPGFRDLLRGLRGRPVLVNVWYPTCAPCVREFPILQAASARYGRRMAFLGVVTQGSTDEIDAFLKEHPTVYPHVRDPGKRIARDLRTGQAFPSSVLIDARGEILDVHIGEYPSPADLERDLARLGIGPDDQQTTTAPRAAAAPAPAGATR